MDAISVPSPPRLTPMISADRSSVNPDSSSAAGTLLITWLAATPARTSCPEMSCYRLYRRTDKIDGDSLQNHDRNHQLPCPPDRTQKHLSGTRNASLFCSLAMTLIRQNRNASVRKSHSPDILCQGLQKAWNSNPSISGSILDCMRCWTAAWKILRSTFPMTNEGVPVSTPSAFISYI